MPGSAFFLSLFPHSTWPNTFGTHHLMFNATVLYAMAFSSPDSMSSLKLGVSLIHVHPLQDQAQGSSTPEADAAEQQVRMGGKTSRAIGVRTSPIP